MDNCTEHHSEEIGLYVYKVSLQRIKHNPPKNDTTDMHNTKLHKYMFGSCKCGFPKKKDLWLSWDGLGWVTREAQKDYLDPESIPALQLPAVATAIKTGMIITPLRPKVLSAKVW